MKSLKILTVFNLHTYHIFLEVFKCLRTHTPFPILSLLQIERIDKFKLRTPAVKNYAWQSSFTAQAPHIWNKLVEQMLYKETINAKIVQKLGRSKFPTLITVKSKIYDISLSICSIKTKLKNLLIDNQSTGDIQWTNLNHSIPQKAKHI